MTLSQKARSLRQRMQRTQSFCSIIEEMVEHFFFLKLVKLIFSEKNFEKKFSQFYIIQNRTQ